MSSLTIGALAKRAGVGVETVRFYERPGLVRCPARSVAGYRKYPEEAVGRIRFIRDAQALGFTLQEIKEIFALRVTVGTSCAAVRCRAAAKVAELNRRLVALARIRAALETLIAACPGRGALASCTISSRSMPLNPALPKAVRHVESVAKTGFRRCEHSNWQSMECSAKAAQARSSRCFRGSQA